MEPTLFQQLFNLWQNAALLVLGVLAYSWLRGVLECWPRPVRACVEGLVGFGLAVLCMSAPLRLAPGVQIDSRGAMVALVTVFSGPFAGTITAAATAAYRLWLGGVGALSGVVGVAANFGVSLPFWYWLRARNAPPDYRDIAVLALAGGVALGAAMLFGLLAEPYALTIELWRRSVIAVLTIVPGSIFVLGAIIVRFERGRAAEHRVAESEARLRSILDNLPHPLSLKDRHDRFLLVNRAYERDIGLSAAELVGQPAKVVADQIQGFGPGREMQQRVWRTGEAAQTPPLPVCHHGRSTSVVISSFPMRNADGGFDAIGTIVTDVTELLAAQDKLAEREASLQRQHQALVEILRGNAIAERPMIETVRALTEITADVVGADGAAMHLIDHGGGVLRCVDAFRRGRGHEIVPAGELSSYPALIADLERQRVVAIDDALADLRLADRVEILRARGVRSMIIAGIYLGARLEGQFTFVSTEASSSLDGRGRRLRARGGGSAGAHAVDEPAPRGARRARSRQRRDLCRARGWQRDLRQFASLRACRSAADVRPRAFRRCRLSTAQRAAGGRARCA